MRLAMRPATSSALVVFLSGAIAALPCAAQEAAPVSKSDEAAANLVRGNVGQAVADYTAAL